MVIDDIEALVRVGWDRDDGLVERLRTAIEAPERYVEAHGQELELRGIDAPVPELPTVALIDGLMVHERAAELDWRSSAVDFLEALTSLRVAARADETVGRLCEELATMQEESWDWSPEQARVRSDAVLARHGLARLVFDFGSDSEAFTCVPTEALDPIHRLSARLTVSVVREPAQGCR